MSRERMMTKNFLFSMCSFSYLVVVWLETRKKSEVASWPSFIWCMLMNLPSTREARIKALWMRWPDFIIREGLGVYIGLYSYSDDCCMINKERLIQRYTRKHENIIMYLIPFFLKEEIRFFSIASPRSFICSSAFWHVRPGI
jgi:hypothetical protein